MNIDTEYAKHMATQLANFQVQTPRYRAKVNEARYNAQLKAVNSLESALRTFRTAANGLRSGGSSMLVNSATFSQPEYATATVAARAAPGSYQFFVEQLASKQQTAVQGLTNADLPGSGSLSFSQNGEAFDVDLTGLDTLDKLAAAINGAADNTGVQATLVRSAGNVSLVLSSKNSGLANAFSVSTDAGGAFAAAVDAPVSLTTAQDARVRLGGEGGMLLSNASNTFDDVIDGVSLTFNKTHVSGEAPLSLTIGQDKSATEAKMKSFIDAFNALLSAFDSQTGSGSESTQRGILAGDSSIRSVENMLNQVVRTAFGGKSLIDFGVAANRNGRLTLNAERFAKAVAADPAGLDKIFTERNGLIETLDKNLGVYTSSVNGVMKNRKEVINGQIRRVRDQNEALDRQYDQYYNRYLRQYTSMMEVMASMQQTQSMF
jgi:flagellar hook-associated protein 2